MYFSDARFPVQQAGFNSTFFADGLSCYREYAKELNREAVWEDLEERG